MSTLGASGFQWATPHTLRRSAITWRAEQGVPIRAVADFAGHANVAMTQNVYLGRDRGNVTAGGTGTVTAARLPNSWGRTLGRPMLFMTAQHFRAFCAPSGT